MNDSISRQAAKEMLNDNELARQADDVFDGDLHRYKRAAQRIIAQLPTVDAVPVVRCKDCKWYGRADKRRFYRGMDCLQKRIDTIVPDKDFCSRAERREESEIDKWWERNETVNAERNEE